MATETTESPLLSGPQSSKPLNVMVPTDDKWFLVYFIMGNYFGPDLRGEEQPKSVLQRKAEGYPPYTYEQLARSNIPLAEVKSVYFYMLREADPSLKLELSLLQHFFQGTLQGAGIYPQFLDLYPLELHPHLCFQDKKVIESVVFINNPEVLHIRPEDIERFKRLSGLDSLLLDRGAARLHTSIDISNLYDVAVQPIQSIEGFIALKDSSDNGASTTPIPSKERTGPTAKDGPAMIFLPSHPPKQEWDNVLNATKSGFAMTGSAALGQVGPVVGRMDIGECEDSYMFRVSLPGVKRDEKDFSCGVESNGKISIRGVTTTGEKRVFKHSQVFEMQTRNLCPPGHFSVSFHLPGPVDPKQFSGNFGTDGILEGIVMKQKE